MNRPSDVIGLGERPPAVSGAGADRGTAFVRLADAHLDRAYGLARAILRDPVEAQDATHDAFVRAWRSWDWETLRDPTRFEAWFDRILVNTCKNRIRASRRLTSDLSEELAATTGDPFDAAADRDRIAHAVARLSPDHQVVIALRFYRDLTVDGIAERLGIPPGTVRSRLHYATKQLQGALDAPDGEGSNR
jgi:RNA polymerase sigma-70 factor, ECF subfamily